jgi:hypothetical protein
LRKRRPQPAQVAAQGSRVQRLGASHVPLGDDLQPGRRARLSQPPTNVRRRGGSQTVRSSTDWCGSKTPWRQNHAPHQVGRGATDGGQSKWAAGSGQGAAALSRTAARLRVRLRTSPLVHLFCFAFRSCAFAS